MLLAGGGAYPRVLCPYDSGDTVEHKIPPTATVVMNWVKASASRENGDFCAEVRRWSNGTVEIRNSKTPDIPALAFTAEEWSAFESGVRAGEFSEGRS